MWNRRLSTALFSTPFCFLFLTSGAAQMQQAATAAAASMAAQRVDEAVRAAGAHIEARVAGAEQAVEFVQQQQHGTQVLYAGRCVRV